MSWTRGERGTDYELSRVQSWVETNDIALNGPDGDDGVIREWRDFRSKKEAFETFMRWTLAAIGLLVAIPAALVSLSALGVIHLR